MLDRYSIKARLWPALLAGMPASLGIATLLDLEWWNSSIVAGASGIGLMFLLAQVARKLGKNCEAKLFAAWGGKPSVRFLRHVDDHFDFHTKARYHGNVARLFGIHMPTAAQERDNPQAAESAYEAATVGLLRETRDTNRFSLLFDENINFGFCRNLLGLKPTGIALSLFGLATGGYQVAANFSASESIAVFPTLTTAASLLMLYVWFFIVDEDWPKTAAFAFADRLFEASDALASSPHQHQP